MKIVSEIDDLVGTWEDGKPLVFQVAFDTNPEVSWKSSYRDLKVSCPVMILRPPLSERNHIHE